MDPAPLTIAARWPVQRRLVVDFAMGGAVLGVVGGTIVFGRPGVFGLIVGAAVAASAGLVLASRRLHLTLDASGVRIGRLTGTVHVRWEDVVVLGIQDGWQGRRGRTTALALGRRGDEWPMVVPALSYAASGFRVGATPPAEQLAPHRAALLEPVRAWAVARRITLVDSDVDDWWDRARPTPSSPPPGLRRE